jgi:hypothetical protein
VPLSERTITELSEIGAEELPEAIIPTMLIIPIATMIIVKIRRPTIVAAVYLRKSFMIITDKLYDF